MEVLPGPLPDGRRSGGDEGLGSRLPSLVFPTAMVVKVKDAETKRNKASVAHTGLNKRKKTQYDNTKKSPFVSK